MTTPIPFLQRYQCTTESEVMPGADDTSSDRSLRITGADAPSIGTTVSATKKETFDES